MDLSFITQYTVLVIVGVCLCVGYIIKNLIPSEKINRYIPLIMGSIGLAMNVWITESVTADVILAGLFSGLASTGLFESFKNLLKKPDGVLVIDKSNPEKDSYNLELDTPLSDLDSMNHITLKISKK